jgi:archaemetzincin
MGLELRGLGTLPPGLLDDLVAFLAGRLGIPCRTGPAGPDPRWALDPARGQLDARRLLASLGEDVPPGDRVLGVVDEDLGSPLFTFVFGEATLNGRAAVVSLHRLRPEHYGLPADPARLWSRSRRVVLHEAGHLLGLVHCRDPGCVMRFSGAAEEVDLRGDVFCEACGADLADRLPALPSGAALSRSPGRSPGPPGAG